MVLTYQRLLAGADDALSHMCTRPAFGALNTIKLAQAAACCKGWLWLHASS